MHPARHLVALIKNVVELMIKLIVKLMVIHGSATLSHSLSRAGAAGNGTPRRHVHRCPLPGLLLSEYRGTSLIRKRAPPGTTIGPQVQPCCRVLRGGVFLSSRYPCMATWVSLETLVSLLFQGLCVQMGSACLSSTRVDRLRVGWLNGWEGYHESRRCSTDTYPESYILKYTSIRR